MTTQVFTIGYYGREVDDVHRLALSLDATVFDIRLSPRSRVPQWSGKRLREALGARYQHVRELGNLNYKGGPIQIADLETGISLIRQSHRPVILMCVCKHAKKCHRTWIATRLKERGFQVSEINDPAEFHDPKARLNPATRRARQMAFDL